MDTSSIPVPASLSDQIRIALPMQGAAFSEHFGGASHFRFITADRATRRVVSQTDMQAPEHTPGSFPRWLAQQGVQALIVGGIGKRAVEMLAASGIPIFIARGGGTPEELVAQQLEGSLAQATMDDCCAGHSHDHGHEHASHCH